MAEGYQNTICQVNDYYNANDYHIRVCQIGKAVIVSGYIIGNGVQGYTGPVLPKFTYSSTDVGSNALIFYARNQGDGTTIQLRCGGEFQIFRLSTMNDNMKYAFAFSYCAE